MKIIFHGDDFGLTSGINRGIILSFKEGLLSSTSIVAGGEAAEEALSLAGENPGLDVGIHLVLCDEPPLLPIQRLSSIISGKDSFPSKRKILQRILAKKVDFDQVEAEWNAQIEKCLHSGIAISHIDSHQFLHLFPGLFPLCLRVAARYKIPYVRTSIFDLIDPEVGLKRRLQWFSLVLWTRTFVLRSLPTNTGTVPVTGFLNAGGTMKPHYILRVVDRLIRQGSCPVIEVMLHPGIGDSHTLKKYRHWHYDWKQDMDLLRDQSLKEALHRRGLQTTSFRELEGFG